MKFIEKDINTQENIKNYSKKREEYFRTRVNKYSTQKNYLLDNPYNQRIIEKLNIHKTKEQELPKKILVEKIQPQVREQIGVSKAVSALNLETKLYEDISPVHAKARLGSAKNISKRNIQSAYVNKPSGGYNLETNYIGMTTMGSLMHVPTSPTYRLHTYDYNTTLGNNFQTLKNEKPKIRLMSAAMPRGPKTIEPFTDGRKSILTETTKSKFNQCIEINKQFLLKNNPNMCLLQVAEIFGSSKLIHYKNINI
jgi:hypothetical protein